MRLQTNMEMAEPLCSVVIMQPHGLAFSVGRKGNAKAIKTH